MSTQPGSHRVPSFEEYVDSGGSPELDKVLGSQKLDTEPEDIVEQSEALKYKEG